MRFSTTFFLALHALVVGSSLCRGEEQLQQKLRGGVASSTPRRHRHLSVLSDGSIDFADRGKSATVKNGSTNNNVNQKGYVMTFNLGQGKVIQARSSPQDQEIEIHRIGNKKNDMTEEDRAFLKELADALDADVELDTYEVNTLPSQASRMAKVLNEWPSTLDLDYVLDVVAEANRAAQRAEVLANLPPPSEAAPEVPLDDRRLANAVRPDQIQEENEDAHSNGRRRLAYTSLCYAYNTFKQASHDDWWYDYGDDASTYYAYVSMHPSQPCAEGTKYWNNGAWQCYSSEPDHSTSIEYAYGSCFGRCGAGCGSNTQFTQDCLDHDSCVRFGHDLASLWCDDEFSFTVDDALFAPNCF